MKFEIGDKVIYNRILKGTIINIKDINNARLYLIDMKDHQIYSNEYKITLDIEEIRNNKLKLLGL